MSRIVVVSNRVVAQGAARAGGLSVALNAALGGEPAVWFGWSGETTARYSGELSSFNVGEVQVVTVDLEEADVDEYYNGYANSTLWPVFHSRTDLAAYDRSFDEGYARVNRRFAAALAPLLRPDDLVWVHDYHLIPLGQELRALGVANPIGFFLHIPWPAPQLFTTLPRHQALVRALFAYDLVGLQTAECVGAFEAYVLGEGGGTNEDGRLHAFGRHIRCDAFPIGLDTPAFLALSRSPEAERACDRMEAHGLFRSLIVGVDRLDYSKGIPERLVGFERYLRDHPEMVRKVLYLQIAPSSREAVNAYQALSANVLSLAGRINAAWAEMDHAPVLYVNRNYSRTELAGIYRAARVGLVTPLRDGMNLVAKEYVAAQDPEDPGVLVLSRFAGAAQQMKDALIVNPYAPEEVADSLHAALRMPLAERRRRWERLMAGLERDDVSAWRDRFIAALMATGEARAPDAERPVVGAPRIGEAARTAEVDAPTLLDLRSGTGTAGSTPGWPKTEPG
jgi:trehalose 6-phosphate synthase